MAAVHVLTFFLIALAAGYLFKMTLCETIPMVWCGLILVLYVLAFWRGLHLIDILAPAAAMLFVPAALRLRSGRRGGGERGALAVYLRENLRAPGVLVYLMLCLLLPLFLRQWRVTWWDDINYWACDLKSLYHLGGFADRYANVAPQFGDYPPATQLAKWYLLHLGADAFREDLAFVGYQLFNLSFLLPVYKRLKRPLSAFLLLVPTWLFAGIGDVFGYRGFCADLSMAMLFGNVLLLCVEGKSAVCAALYLAVLCLCKSTGFLWAFAALAIWVGYRWRDGSGISPAKLWRVLSPAAGALPAGASWLIFCYTRRRVAKSTSVMLTYLTTDRYALSEHRRRLASSFLRAFFLHPLHGYRPWIGLPPAMFFALIALLLWVLRSRGILPGRRGRRFRILLLLSGLLYYGLIFFAHITIFGMETQYLEPLEMTASIERYGLPFVIGSMLLFAGCFLGAETFGGGGKGEALRAAAFAAAVVLLSNPPAAYDGLIGYHSALRAAEATAIAPDSDSGAFLSELGRVFGDFFRGEGRRAEGGRESFPPGGVRVVRVRTDGDHRVNDTFTAYAASPVSVMTVACALAQTDADAFVRAVGETHAVYLYADRQEEAAFLSDMAADGRFAFQTLYRIVYEDGAMRLRRAGA